MGPLQPPTRHRVVIVAFSPEKAAFYQPWYFVTDGSHQLCSFSPHFVLLPDWLLSFFIRGFACWPPGGLLESVRSLWRSSCPQTSIGRAQIPFGGFWEAGWSLQVLLCSEEPNGDDRRRAAALGVCPCICHTMSIETVCDWVCVCVSVCVGERERNWMEVLIRRLN